MTVCRLAVAILVTACGEAMGQTSFWNSSVIPRTPGVTNDGASVTLGLKFYSDVPGTVTAVRFYKGSGNTGTHVGNLWSSTGAKLASVTFSGETGSGWQQANFSSPISIAANTTYVVSYLAPRGSYACDQYYSWSTLSAGQLHVSGSSPGVFAYGSSTAFPNGTWNRSNYFVDLVFVPAGAGSGTPSTYTISGNVRGSAARLTLSGTSSGTATTDAAGNYSFSGVRNGSYVVAPSQSGYTFTPSTAAVSITGASKTGVNFTSTAVPPTTSRSIRLSWTASTTPNIKGYYVYRASVAGGAYTKLNASPVAATTYLDSGVPSGRTYYYVATTVNNNNNESTYSTLATAVVP
jgi:hypothetical protein